MLRFIIPNDGTRQNRRMNAHYAGAAEKEFLINFRRHRLESAQIDEYEQGKGRSEVCERAAKWNLISFISRK